MALHFMVEARLRGLFYFLVLSGLILIYFWAPLTQGFIFIERDIPVFFFPPLTLWVEAFKTGHIPLWNPYSFGGQPLFASLQTGILYPPNLLLLILPVAWAFNATIALHFLLAGVFIFLLCRRLGGSPGAGLLAAISFTFGGFLLSVHNVVSTLQSVTWAPLIFFFLLKALGRGTWSLVLLTALAVLVQFLGGGIEVFLLTQVLVLFLGLFPGTLLPEKEFIPLIGRLKALAAIYLLFLGLGAVQILPFLEMVQQSFRSTGFSYEEATRWSLAWRELVYIFLPDFFWRGTKYYYVDQNWLKSIYLGVVPLLLVFFYFLGRDRRRIWFGIFMIIPLVMALGKNTPFYGLLYAAVPGLSKIHYPVKFFFLTNLFLCLLTGLGWDALAQRLSGRSNPAGKRLKRIFLSLALLMALFLVAFSLYRDPLLSFFKDWVAISYDRPWEFNLHNLSRVVFYGLLSFLLFFFLADRKLSPKWGQIGVILLLLSDLFLGNWGQYKAIDRETFLKSSPNLERVLKDPSRPRVYTDIWVLKSVSFGENDEKMAALFYQERFNMDYTVIHRIYNASGFPVLLYRPYKNLLNLLETSPNPQATDLLRIMNVKYLLWHEEVKDPCLPTPPERPPPSPAPSGGQSRSQQTAALQTDPAPPLRKRPGVAPGFSGAGFPSCRR